ncbi:MAG TPA: hypothetical protein VMB25_19455, partial [Bryobacteraceae bacterium]|nr:hypothetical protein [Bryobacteraceae bacterium]
WSQLFFPTFMGTAQEQLAIVQAGNPNHTVPPISPPLTPGVLAPGTEEQFENLLKSIGFAIGSSAAHETGHQLTLPLMDCNKSNLIPNCPKEVNQNGINQNGMVYEDGYADYWFFGTIPGQPAINWLSENQCVLAAFLSSDKKKYLQCLNQ